MEFIFFLCLYRSILFTKLGCSDDKWWAEKITSAGERSLTLFAMSMSRDVIASPAVAGRSNPMGEPVIPMNPEKSKSH